MEILVKLEKKMQAISAAKQIIIGAKIQLQQMKGFSSVRINVDVDPYWVSVLSFLLVPIFHVHKIKRKMVKKCNQK